MMEDVAPDLRSRTTDMLRNASDVMREMAKTAFMRKQAGPVVDILKLRRLLGDDNFGKPQKNGV